MTDYTKQYTDLIPIQYWSKEKAFADVELFASEFESVFDILKSFEVEFDLDVAWGDRLDLIGKIVGQSRIISEAIAKRYFGFDGVANAKTFGEGKMFDLYRDTGYTSTQLDDNTYRFFIRSRIAKNIAYAQLSHENNQSLQDAIQVMFQSQAYVVDNYDMSLSLYISSIYDTDDINIILSENLLPNPNGVSYQIIIIYDEGETFGFANNPASQTFGMGKFAQLYVA